MNTIQNSLFSTSFTNLQETLTTTTRQRSIGKIVLVIFAAAMAAYAVFKFYHAYYRKVTVIEDNGNTFSTQIRKVNGKAKVIFDSFGPYKGTTYEGEFKDGRLHGPGKMILLAWPHHAHDHVMEGQFKNGFLEKGKITFFPGFEREGNFKKDTDDRYFFLEADNTITYRLHGPGGKEIMNGIIREGEFQCGKLHGRGKVTYPGGRIEEGQFNQGVFVG